MKPAYLVLFLLIPLCSYGVEFNQDVKPILSRKCFSCHNSDKQKGKLRLDIRKEALKVLTPDKNNVIRLLNRIEHKDPDEIMPPPEDGKLTDNEKNILKKWISEGAKYDTHWAFKPLKKIDTPQINDDWIINDIDKFIHKKISENSLTKNSVKFDYKLLRRLSLLTTGLPPDEADFEKFLKGQLNYEDYVDKLLDTPSYGEHMASFWLDGARYGDTNGIEYDNSRPIWPYRDWVIKAFNNNMPYDQFAIEQIAGDLLPNSTIQQKVATGFLRCNVSTNEPGSIEEEYKIAYAKDRLNTTASVFLGLTINCAECHDHKYDPISQKEYYQLLAFFNNIDGIAVGQPFDRSDPPLIPITSDSDTLKLNEIDTKETELKNKMREIKQNAQDSFWWWHYQQLAAPPKDLFLMSKMDVYFPLDENEGSTTYNLITEHKCNIKGNFLRKKGIYGKSLGFKASSFVDCLNVANYKKTSTFSVGCWLYPEIENTGTILAKFDSKYKKGWKLSIDKGHLFFHLSGSEDDSIIIQTNEPISNNEWTYITLTYDGTCTASGLKFYLNGKSVKSKIIKNDLKGDIEFERNLRIGVESYANNLRECAVDEVFATGLTLSQNQIELISKFQAVSRFILLKPKDLTPSQKEILFLYYLENFHEKYSVLHKNLKAILAKKEEIISKSVISMVMKDSKSLEKTYILKRGNYQSPGEEVFRNTPKFLPSIPKNHTMNRFGLAKWIASRDNPLFARSISNKIWSIYFGKGLTNTLGDLGAQGDFPSHPELLEYLSNYLINNNWDLKKLSKLILMSSTFKQSSIYTKNSMHIDPENKYYSWFPRQRLRAEVIRDQILDVSQMLVYKVGGAPVFPYQPPGLWKEVTSEDSNTSLYKQSNGNDNYRRSIYTFWKRNLPPPSMTIFDAPSRQFCTLQRNNSNTPLQALVLLNDPQFHESYQNIGSYFQKLKTKKEENINLIFRKLLYRNPTNEEITICLKFLSQNNEKWTLLAQSLINLDEFISTE